MRDKDALLRLLDLCTARLVVNDGREVGTGFFVGPGYLLTCAHVVSAGRESGGKIEVEWNKVSYLATIEQITDKTYPDLALVKVSAITGHPCVYLFSEILHNDECYTYGYPREYVNGDPLTFRYIGPTGAPQVLHTFNMGNLRPGFSGSPLLNIRTGAICGVVKRTSGENTLLGGRAVPIEQAFQIFPLLKALQELSHRQDARWAECLTSQQCQANGLSKLNVTIEKQAVEIFFSYHDNKKDLGIFKALENQLVMLRRNKVIDAWHKDQLMSGEEIEDETMRHLDTARVICLLVSPDYVADDTLYEAHVTRAMERRAKDGVTIIPILVRPTAGWEDTSFGKLRPLPLNKLPMDQWKSLDDVSAHVALEIRKIAEKIRSA